MRSALSSKLLDQRLWCVQDLQIPSFRVADAREALRAWGLFDKRCKALVIVGDEDDVDDFALATRNFHNITLERQLAVHTLHLLQHEHVIMTPSAKQQLTDRLLPR